MSDNLLWRSPAEEIKVDELDPGSERALDEWEEAIGLLKEVDKSGRKIVLEARREVAVKLPAGKMDELGGAVGEKVSILRTDGTNADGFLIRVGEREESKGGDGW